MSKTLEGINGIKLEILDGPGNPEKVYEKIFDMTMETFRPESSEWLPKNEENIKKIVRDVMEGNTLRNALESIKIAFRFENVSRTMTHQWVRTRIGAGYTQLSERANDVGDVPVRIPYPIAEDSELKEEWEEAIEKVKDVYKKSLDKGKHTQDARFILPQGTVSHISTTMTLNTIENVIKRRGCLNMQWEIHYATMMLARWIQQWDDIGIIGEKMKPLCDKKGVCVWENYDFAPCGRHPLPDDYEEKEYIGNKENNGSKEFYDYEKHEYKK